MAPRNPQETWLYRIVAFLMRPERRLEMDPSQRPGLPSVFFVTVAAALALAMMLEAKNGSITPGNSVSTSMRTAPPHFRPLTLYPSRFSRSRAVSLGWAPTFSQYSTRSCFRLTRASGFLLAGS